MTKNALLFTVLTCLAVPAWAADLPNPVMTPGATNSDVTQANIERTICVRGYTKTIRPPAYYTNRLKKEQLAQYGYADRNPRHYEEDHLIPLEIGGNPTDPRNLWPEPRNSLRHARPQNLNLSDCPINQELRPVFSGC
jgi:hypothetical protein